MGADCKCCDIQGITLDSSDKASLNKVFYNHTVYFTIQGREPDETHYTSSHESTRATMMPKMSLAFKTHQKAQQNNEEDPKNDPNDDPNHTARRQAGAAATSCVAQRAFGAEHRYRDCGIQIAGASIARQVLIRACIQNALAVAPQKQY